MKLAGKKTHQKLGYNKVMDNTTKQEKPIKTLKGGVPINTERQFGKPNGNPRNNGGIPKYVREIRSEIKNLLDPNLTIEDYQKIVESAKTDSGLRGVFATAIIKKDYKTILQLIDQAYGKPNQTIDHTIIEPPKPLEDLTKE